MYKQALSRELKPQPGRLESMAYRSNAEILRREIRRQLRKYIVRSLGQAMAGGALGAYLLAIGFALYSYASRDQVFLLLGFPFILAAGAGIGLANGALMLVMEGLIEERLPTKWRVVVTSVIGILLLLGLASFDGPIEWRLVLRVTLPGAVLGFPVGLLVRSKAPLWRSLVYGANQTGVLEGDGDEAADRVLAAFRLVGGLALRLVSILGILSSTMVLAAFWYSQEADERLVTVYAIYYFLCTAYISFTVRHRGVILGAGVLLNGLLLILALFWDHSAPNGQPGPMLAAYLVLTVLWLLFFVGQRRPRVVQTLRVSHAEN